MSIGLKRLLGREKTPGTFSPCLGMRNILVHAYFAIDKDIVWSVVDQDLPDLKRQIEAILLQTN